MDAQCEPCKVRHSPERFVVSVSVVFDVTISDQITQGVNVVSEMAKM